MQTNGSELLLRNARFFIKNVERVSQKSCRATVFRENEMPIAAWMLHQTTETHRAAQAKFIPIPRIKVTDAGVEEYVFVDFDLDMSEFTHAPIKNEFLIQNLEDMQDRRRIKGDAIDFEGYNPKKVILEQLRAKPEIDYEKCSDLLFKLITQLCDHQVWTITNETASIYPCIIAALIKAIFLRDATGSIEV